MKKRDQKKPRRFPKDPFAPIAPVGGENYSYSENKNNKIPEPLYQTLSFPNKDNEEVLTLIKGAYLWCGKTPPDYYYGGGQILMDGVDFKLKELLWEYLSDQIADNPKTIEIIRNVIGGYSNDIFTKLNVDQYFPENESVRLRAPLYKYREWADRLGESPPFLSGKVTKQPQDEVNQLKAENKKLKAENERLKKEKMPWGDKEHEHFSSKLEGAVSAWKALFIDGYLRRNRGIKEQITGWLKENRADLRNVPNLVKMINPDNNQEGGAPPSEGETEDPVKAKKSKKRNAVKRKKPKNSK